MCPEFSSLYTFICLVFASLDKQGLIIIIGILQRRKKNQGITYYHIQQSQGLG